MRFIPTMIHGITDYAVGMIVIGLPFLFGWTGSQRWTLIALGAFAILYSLCTDYELGAVRLVPMRTHLLLDAVFGVLMLVLPWALNFSQDSHLPMSVIGILALILTVTTKTHARDSHGLT
jgi:uncharacterized YccA/Bax inhibitor family protein